MLNSINKERRRSKNATPTPRSNKNQRQRSQEDPKQKPDRTQGRALKDNHLNDTLKKKL
jgi:hypothetical protein